MNFDELFYHNADTGRLHWKVKFCRSMNAGDVAGDINGQGYYRVTMGGKQYLAHRIIWDLLHPDDKLASKDEVDHIDHNPLNNRADNLRKATRTINGRNMSKPANNTSGAVGVYWKKREQMWLAQIKVDQKALHIGYFKDKESAIAARKTAEIAHGFHENHGK